MTEGNGENIGFRAALSRAAGQLVEEYVGEESDQPNVILKILTKTLRGLSAFAGVMTLLSFLFAFKKIGGERLTLSTATEGDFAPAFWIIVFFVPALLGYSMKRGSPLRFYVMGFFLSGALMTIGIRVATG